MQQDKIKLEGWVTIETLGENGEVLDVVEGPNLITTLGKTNAENLLSGNSAGKRITQMAFGTNGTAPDPADTVITSPLVKNITTYTNAPGNNLVMETTIATGDPAMTIREVGLLNADGVLCHRKVFDPEKTKVAGIAYHVTYKIKVV